MSGLLSAGQRAESPLDVLVVQDEPTIASVIAAALERRGHTVTIVRNAEEALELPSPVSLVCDVALPGISGLTLVERLLARGANPRVVFLSGFPTLEDCRNAMRLGASEFLAKPFRLEELVRAVEGAKPALLGNTPVGPIPIGPISAEPAAVRPRAFARTFAATVEGVELAALELLAFLVRQGIGPTTRSRVASACAEVLDNAQRHAYVHDGGKIEVEASIDGRELAVRIADDGFGFEAARVASESLRTPQTSGLARVAALAEDLRVDSAPGRGARVSLRFACTLVRFDGDELVDLSELDFLTPELARRVLRALGEREGEPRFQLSPALAVTVGRLLSARAPEPAVQDARRG